MKWTEPRKPTEGISFYDHVTCQTPLGEMIIEWKSWKDRISYDVELDQSWIGQASSLREAKKLAAEHLQRKFDEFREYLENDEY